MPRHQIQFAIDLSPFYPPARFDKLLILWHHTQVRKIFLLAGFVVGNIALLLLALIFLVFYFPSVSSHKIEAQESTEPPISKDYDKPFLAFEVQTLTPVQIDQTIIADDSRPTILDNFFKKNNSPMIGLGDFVVRTADKYSVPFGLLPAIAMCEGNLGKVMPENSYNPYGWGIYGEKKTKFESWEVGIEKVIKGLKSNYLGQGLVTAEQMMKKYTPPSNGSWAFCVNQFLDELK